MSCTSQPTSIRKFITSIVPSCFLPAIQRELVWDSWKMENLFDSITRGYPIGTLLLWEVGTPAIRDYSFYELVREYDAEKPHNARANLDERSACYGILDGQQRTTALLLGLKGSFREKLPRKWKRSADAWVTKKLYLNLLGKPEEGDANRKFEFKFLSEDEAKQRQDASHCWFRAGQILQYPTEQELRDWRRSTAHKDNPVFEDNLKQFWGAIEHPTGITYFLESSQDLNEVLTIFVRLNTGGEPLSYSDLLLSLATATWRSHDARKEVYDLVDKLNEDCGAHFSFTKDFVLKALLVLNDGDVRFRTENIQRDANLESRWDILKEVLPAAVRLVAAFGFEERTLTAGNAVIPIAYYLHRTGRSRQFLTSPRYTAERESIRLWLHRVLLGRVFGRTTDQVLKRIRHSMQNLTADAPFPSEEILDELKRDQSLAFTPEAVEAVVDGTAYGDPMAFSILALISPIGTDPGLTYDVDHVHPKARFEPDSLRSTGMEEADVQWSIARYNSLPNLQLLPSTVNKSKKDLGYAEWLNAQHRPDLYRDVGLTPEGLSLDLCDFRRFYEKRRGIVIGRLGKVLGVQMPIVPTTETAGKPVCSDSTGNTT